MKIPYTVWWSSSRKVLEQAANLLKNKDFETWNDDDQYQISKLSKNIHKRCHYFFTIKTDAASSTQLDLDELNIRDKEIAEGANGKVYIGEYRSVVVAIKQFNWENLTDEEITELKESVSNECELMSKLRNPFITSYIGAVTYLSQISLVMQFFELGSLGEYLRKNSPDYFPLPMDLKIKILFDTSRGMQFLHDNNIMHLDLKPDNLLVNSLYADSVCCVKLTDFGTSRFKVLTQDKGLGTPIYLAPECYKDIYTKACDIFSFAITAWEIFYQEEPYSELASLFEIKDYVISGKRLQIDNSMPKLLSQLIEACWKQEPESRPIFEAVTKSLVEIIEDTNKNGEVNSEYDDSMIKSFIEKRMERKEKLLEM